MEREKRKRKVVERELDGPSWSKCKRVELVNLI